MSETHDAVAIVGGGLAGLAAAVAAARAGARVSLFERAAAPGGRAATQARDGFLLNQGPHALYRSGPGMRVLRGLGISPRGGVPNASGGYAVEAGRLHALPGGPVSLLTTGLLTLPAKLEVGRLLARLPRLDAAPLAGVPVEAWLARTIRHPSVRRLLAALFRLATYVDDPAHQSAGLAIGQLQAALAGGVLYLDGGWQTLVDALREAATRAGVRIVSGTRVTALEHDGAVRAVRTAGGERVPAAAVVLAVDPATAVELLAGAASPTLVAFARAARPVRAACLDVCLARLPRPRAAFALGIDAPLYCSVHSAVARLAPEGAAVVQLAEYLPVGESTSAPSEERLEALLDLVQPGWREVVVQRRFLPHLTVVQASADAARGGLGGRPAVADTGVSGCLLAGDWVGPEGWLADASLASGEAAARRAAAAVRTSGSAAA